MLLAPSLYRQVVCAKSLHDVYVCVFASVCCHRLLQLMAVLCSKLAKRWTSLSIVCVPRTGDAARTLERRFIEANTLQNIITNGTYFLLLRALRRRLLASCNNAPPQMSFLWRRWRRYLMLCRGAKLPWYLTWTGLHAIW